MNGSAWLWSYVFTASENEGILSISDCEQELAVCAPCSVSPDPQPAPCAGLSTLADGWAVGHASYLPVFLGASIAPLLAVALVWLLITRPAPHFNPGGHP